MSRPGASPPSFSYLSHLRLYSAAFAQVARSTAILPIRVEGWRPFAAIDALGVLAARHFQAVGRAGEFHPLHGAGVDVLEHDAAPAHQVRRAGQDLERGDAAIGERAAEAGILRPDAVFGPDVGGDRPGRLVAVAVGLHAGRGIVAEVAVDVDHAGGHVFAGAVDRGDGRPPAAPTVWSDRDDLAVGEQHLATVDPAAVTVEDGDVGDQRRDAGIGVIGRREGIAVEQLGRCLGRGGPGRLLVRRSRRARSPAPAAPRQLPRPASSSPFRVLRG